MKKVFLSIIAIIFILPIMVKAQEKVKVYIFEAGGCPYCEAQIEYLEGLDSYNKKFEIVKKEAEDATYQATPFVVISDIYAAAAYNTSLESVIDEAYEKGDKDIVKCYEEGNTNCLDHLAVATTSSSKSDNKSVIITIIISTVLIIATYLVKSTLDTKRIIDSKTKKVSKKKKEEVNEK